jgi:Major Facilitator Superfamily
VSVAALLVAVLADALSLPLIFLTAAALGVADVVAGIAGTSIAPSAIPKHRWQTAVARITGVEYLFSGFVGAPIGGLLVAAGFLVALYAAGAAYLVGALLLFMLVGNFGVQRTAERRSVHAEIKDGLRFLWSSTLLRTMALLITVMAGCWAAWIALIPVYAVGGPLGLEPEQYGLLLTCLGAGGVVGALAVGRVNKLLGRRWSMFVDIVGTFALVGMPALLPAQPSSALPIAAAAFVAGAGGTMWTVNSRVIVQVFVPDDMLGRFSSASRMVAWGMTPVAAFVVGVLAQVFSYRVAFGFFAALCLGLVYPFFRVITAAAMDEVDRVLLDEAT